MFEDEVFLTKKRVFRLISGTCFWKVLSIAIIYCLLFRCIFYNMVMLLVIVVTVENFLLTIVLLAVPVHVLLSGFLYWKIDWVRQHLSQSHLPSKLISLRLERLVDIFTYIILFQIHLGCNKMTQWKLSGQPVHSWSDCKGYIGKL